MHLGTSENANIAEETKVDEGALENGRVEKVINQQLSLLLGITQ